MNPWLAAFFGFGVGLSTGIGFMIYLLISSHNRELAAVIKHPRGK